MVSIVVHTPAGHVLCVPSLCVCVCAVAEAKGLRVPQIKSKKSQISLFFKIFYLKCKHDTNQLFLFLFFLIKHNYTTHNLKHNPCTIISV